MNKDKDKKQPGGLPSDKVITQDDVVGELDVPQDNVPQSSLPEEHPVFSEDVIAPDKPDVPNLKDEQSYSGSAPDPEDVEPDVGGMVEKATGEEPKTEPYSIGKKVQENELERRRPPRPEEEDEF